MGLMDFLRGIARAKPGATPLGKEELMEKLLGLNHDKLPYTVEKGGEIDLLAEWKIADAAWYELFAKAELDKNHKLWLFLDEKERAVKALDEVYSVEWRAGVPSVSLRAEMFRGRVIASKISPA